MLSDETSASLPREINGWLITLMVVVGVSCLIAAEWVNETLLPWLNLGGIHLLAVLLVAVGGTYFTVMPIQYRGRLRAQLVQTIASNNQEIQARMQFEEALRRRVAQEELVATIATQLANHPLAHADAELESALEALGSFIGAEVAGIFLRSDGPALYTRTHSWRSQQLVASRGGPGLPAANFGWLIERLERHEIVRLDTLNLLAKADPTTYRTLHEFRSLIALPLASDQRLLGWVGFGTITCEKAWTDADQALLRTIAQAMTHALERQRAESALEARVAERTAALQAEISAREQAQALLARERNLLRTVIDNLPDQVFCKDPQGRFVLNNLADTRATGRLDPEGLVGLTDYDVYPEDAAAASRAEDQAVLASGQPLVNREECSQDGAGRWRWMLTSKMPWRDHKGDLLGIVGIGRDITERKLAEVELENAKQELELRVAQRTQELRRANQMLESDLVERRRVEQTLQRYQLLAQNSRDLILFVRYPDGAIVEANEAACRAYGYTRQELLSLGLHDLRADADRSAVQGQLDRAESETLQFESEHKRRDGSTFPVEISSQGSTIGRERVLVSIIRDITDRKNAESAVRASAARAEALARVASRLNTQLDLNAVLTTVCEEAAEALAVPIVTVMLYESTSDLLYLAAHYGIGSANALPPPMPRALHDQMVQEQGPVVFIPNLPRFALDATLPPPEGTQSLCAARMERQGQLVGTLNLISLDGAREFSREEKELLQALADQAAQAITNARLFAETERRAWEFRGLYESVRALGSERDLAALSSLVVERAARLLNATSAALFIYAEAGDKLTLTTARGLLEARVGSQIPLGEGMAGQVALTQQPHVTDCYGTWEGRLEAFQTLDLGAVLQVPMLDHGDLLGVLAVSEAAVTPGALDVKARKFSQSDERLLGLFATQAAGAIHGVRLLAEAEKRMQHLQALREIDLSISSSSDLRLTLKVALEAVTEELGVHAADVLLLNPESQTLSFAGGRGFLTRALQKTRLRVGVGYAGHAALERRTIHVPNLPQAIDGLSEAPLLPDEGFVSYFAVPLFAKGQVKGVLEIFHRARLDPDREWLDFLETLAGQVAIAVDNAGLFDGVQRKNAELILAYDSTLEGWSRALELRDRETEGHTLRCTSMAVRLAQLLGLSEEEIIHLRRGALLHDIGKMGVPDYILLKQGPLSSSEWEEMRLHPVHAYEMLSPIAYLRPALAIPYHHHEKWDGTGYPLGLKGEQIPLAARIFAVVDIWDALLSDRPYRDAWSPEKVTDHLQALAGTHLDPQIVPVFIQLLGETEEA